MTNSISRRNFFSKFGTEVFKNLKETVGDADSETGSEADAKADRTSNPPPGENPFPGQLYWNPLLSLWKPAFAVDSQGRQLASFEDERAFLISFEPPPKGSAAWNFKLGHWTLPLGGRDVYLRITTGRQLRRENFLMTSQVEEAQALRREFAEFFPAWDIRKAFLIGKAQASDSDSEDIISVSFKNGDRPETHWLEKYGAREYVEATNPAVCILKCFLSSKKVLLKFYEEIRDSSQAPSIDLPGQFHGSHFGRTFHLGGTMDQVWDFNFYATNQDVRDFCREKDLVYPEDLFDLGREVQAFGVSYEAESGRILRVKRYYTWWMP